MVVGPAHWLELSFASRHPEFAEEVLFACGAASVTFADAADDPVLEPLPGETPLWPQTLARGLFPASADLDAAQRALRELLPDGATLRFESRAVEDADWVHAWLQYAQPLRFGERLWVVPSGHHVEQRDAVVVNLDPGLAFGTGAHPSTALCLSWLARQDLAGARVLDYGCGSGILAIAARENAARNGVEEKISCAGTEQFSEQAVAMSAGEDLSRAHSARAHEQLFAKPVDIVLANILARPLIELAPMLARCVRVGGSIVLAGLLRTQADDVRAAYTRWFAFEADEAREEWSRIAGTRMR